MSYRQTHEKTQFLVIFFILIICKNYENCGKTIETSGLVLIFSNRANFKL
jgi:hypothetical protein